MARPGANRLPTVSAVNAYGRSQSRPDLAPPQAGQSHHVVGARSPGVSAFHAARHSAEAELELTATSSGQGGGAFEPVAAFRRTGGDAAVLELGHDVAPCLGG